MTSSALGRWLAWVGVSAFGLVLLLFGANRFVGLARRVNAGPGIEAFRYDDTRLLLKLDGRWLVINSSEKSVMSTPMEPALFSRGAIAVVVRDRMVGVPLGDGVKGYEGEWWRFEARTVELGLLQPRPMRLRVLVR